MPYKKNEWGDIPHETYVRDKDVMGRWIVCDICNIKIRCRSQFCFPEWVSHCSGVRHSKIANCEILKKNPRIDTFFKKREATEMTAPVDASDKKKIPRENEKIGILAQDFIMDKIQICFHCITNTKKRKV